MFRGDWLWKYFILARADFSLPKLFRSSGSSLIGVLLFTAMAWHPWTLSGFLADFLDVSVCASAECRPSRHNVFRSSMRPSSEWRWPIFAAEGLILYFWQEWSRTEDPLVFGTWALFAGLAWMLTRRENQSCVVAAEFRVLALPIILVISLSTGVKVINYFHYDVFAKVADGCPWTYRIDEGALQDQARTGLALRSRYPRFAPVSMRG